MTAPITEPDVFYDGPAGDTPLDAQAMNRIWAALMQALLDQLTPRNVGADSSANMRDMLLVDASSGPVHLQAPQALSLGNWGVRKVDASTNPVTITAVGSDLLDEHGRTSYTLVTQDDDAIFSYASPGRFILWREHTTALPATTDRYGPIKIGGDLAGTADTIRVPGKENTGVARELLDAHIAALDPHGDRTAAQQNAAAQILAHTQASDPHGDRSWSQGQFVPLSWFDGQGQLLSSHTPAISIVNTFPVASQAAQLALTAQTGDIAIRTDLGKTYILAGQDPSQFSSWTELPSVGRVNSVNGQQGPVVLGASDVNAAPAVHAGRHVVGGPDDISGSYVPWVNVNGANGVAGLDASARVRPAQLPGASSTAYGGIKLTGGLGGTPDAPTVVGKENTGVAASLIATHSAAADPHGDRAYADGLLSSLHAPPAGGAPGFALIKQTAADYDYIWAAVGSVATTAAQDTKIVSVRSYGAVGDGTTDDTTKINQALAATPAGGVCYFPPGNYGISSPIVVPPQVTLECSHTETLTFAGATPMPTSIKVLPSFTGVSAIRILGKTAGGYTTSSVGQKLRRVTIDCTTAPAGTKGVQVFGFVREAALEYVTVRAATSAGFDFAPDPAATAEQSQAPQSNRVLHCVADNCTGSGFSIVNMPDSTFFDCNAQGSGYVGFYIAGMPNGQLLSCRSEWSAQQGYYITSGYWGSGKGSGGFQMFGCLSDRNGYDGIGVYGANGGGQIQIVGHTFRRDGRNNNAGGGGFAALQVNGSTMTVIADCIAVYPGVDDNAANTGVGNSPQYGVRAVNAAYVAVSGASYVHAAVTPFSDGGGNTVFYRAASIGTAVGTSDAPVRTAPGASLVPNPPIDQPFAAAITPNAALGNYRTTTATANFTLNPPTNPADGQMWRYRFVASGAQVVMTLGTGWRKPAAMPTTLTVPSGRRGDFAAVYDAADGAWTALSLNAQQTATT